MSELTPQQINESLDKLRKWCKHPAAIQKEYVFRDFPTAMTFVNRVAEVAEKAWHHPDLDIRWNKVRVTLTTHDAGGLTSKDFELATACDALAEGLPGPAAAEK